MSPAEIARVSFASAELTGAEVLALPDAVVQDRWRRRLHAVPSLRAQRFLVEHADVGGEPLAAAVAAVRPGQTGQIYSLATAPTHRQRGMATALLARLEARLVDAGCAAVQAVYRTDLRSLVAVETVLAKRGWDPSRPAQYLFRGTATVLDTPTFQNLTLPDGCTLFDWAALTLRDQAALEAEVGRSIPRVLSPFQQPDRLDATCSVGARCGGMVAGWMLLHRTGPEGLRQYTSLWVRPDFVGTSLALVLLRTAIERHAAATPDGAGLFEVDAGNRVMLNLARRRLRLIPEVTLRVAGKRLRPDRVGF